MVVGNFAKIRKFLGGRRGEILALCRKKSLRLRLEISFLQSWRVLASSYQSKSARQLGRRLLQILILMFVALCGRPVQYKISYPERKIFYAIYIYSMFISGYLNNGLNI